jgi:hypothetical protein
MPIHDNEHKFSAVRRRLHYLRQEIYDFEKYYRDAKGEDFIRLRELNQDNREEEEELSFLLDFYEKQLEQREIPNWLFLVSIFLAVLSLFIVFSILQ